MTSMKVIVLSFDRLSLDFLGCYGNEWIETPGFDALAASACVFDRHFAESLGSGLPAHAWWDGCYHDRSGRPAGTDRPTLFERLAAAKVCCQMIAESGTQPPHVTLPAGVAVETVSGRDALDETPDETPFARLIARAGERLRELRAEPDGSWLLWLKSAGAPLPWIAPLDYAALYLDEFEPSPRSDASSQSATVPATPLAPELTALVESLLANADLSHDPDAPPLALGDLSNDECRRLAQLAHAGYVTLLDRSLGRLLDELDDVWGSQEIVLIVTAAEGEPLAAPASEHGLAGHCEQQTHTPMLVRLPSPEHVGRYNDLTQSVDLAPTLYELFGLAPETTDCDGRSLIASIRSSPDAKRDHVCVVDSEARRMIRTDEYLLVEEPSSSEGDAPQEPQHWLFAKPEDVWNLNNLAPQLPEIVGNLAATLARAIDPPESA